MADDGRGRHAVPSAHRRDIAWPCSYAGTSKRSVSGTLVRGSLHPCHAIIRRDPSSLLAIRSCAHPWSWWLPIIVALHRVPTLHLCAICPHSTCSLESPPPFSPCPSTPSFPPLEILRRPRQAVVRVAVWHDIFVRGAGFPVTQICRGQVEAEECSRRCCL